ncbi:hypothetical protein GBA52_024930 [Prunus armeniaca]|nr:hypothetical protein GBA52_024930 [Prunus armeniaca]
MTQTEINNSFKIIDLISFSPNPSNSPPLVLFSPLLQSGDIFASVWTSSWPPLVLFSPLLQSDVAGTQTSTTTLPPRFAFTSSLPTL